MLKKKTLAEIIKEKEDKATKLAKSTSNCATIVYLASAIKPTSIISSVGFLNIGIISFIVVGSICGIVYTCNKLVDTAQVGDIKL